MGLSPNTLFSYTPGARYLKVSWKEKSPMQQHKKKKKKKRETEWEKEDCFPKLVINIDQHLNEALTLLIHTIT